MKNNSYERLVYESVDDESLSFSTSQNWTGEKFQAVMGYGNTKGMDNCLNINTIIMK